MTTFVPHPRLLDSPRHRDWPRLPEPAPPARVTTSATTDVVIVGAGPAGLAIATALWHVGVRDVVLVDRAGPPVARFLDRVDLLDQRVLRSPYEHHPGVEGYRDCELRDFARLHWSLLTPERYRHVAPLADWIEKRRPLATPAGRFHVLPPEEEMLAQVCHAYVHHGLEVFYPLLDIALAASRADLDWDAVTGWCRRASVARMAHFTLAYVDHLFDLGLGDRLARFGVPASPKRAAVFAAHDARLFGEDRLRHCILRWANMVRLAERPWTRTMEVLRILRPQEVAATIRRCPPGRRRRGSQSA